MNNPRVNCSTEGKGQTNMLGSSRTVSRKQSLPSWFLPLLVAMFITALILSSPFIVQTWIYVSTSGDSITDVFVNTPRVSLISAIINPSYGVGVYTINVTINETGETFKIENVSSGDFTIVWKNIGIPSHGNYTVRVQLLRANTIADTFTLPTTF
jgi:hypothetical protein